MVNPIESKRQADDQIEITPEMIEAGKMVYKRWEPNHIFLPPSECGGGAARYAVRKLVKEVYCSMIRAKAYN